MDQGYPEEQFAVEQRGIEIAGLTGEWPWFTRAGGWIKAVDLHPHHIDIWEVPPPPRTASFTVTSRCLSVYQETAYRYIDDYRCIRADAIREKPRLVIRLWKAGGSS